ncbi:tetratricopeptide repeat protein [Photobacterium leiognathi]|uniref:tetratricopeptide repeat protein n=1 Tax=Photobacterium leiognathi TaxID=553611 RepID=UPI0029811439|nr:tetratricopeptide repeat protein [Photobacterium leiognathi]
MRFLLIITVSLTLSGCVSPQAHHGASIDNLEKVGNYQGIVDHYRKQLVNKPNNPTTMLKLADAYCHLGDTESAQFYISQLTSPSLHNGEYYFVAGNIDMAAEQYQSAVKKYDQAINKHINNPAIYIKKGIAYGYLYDYKNASHSFNQARLHGYDENIVKNNLATLKIAQNQNQQAVDLLLPVYQHNPKNKKVAFNLAIALVRAGDITQAKQILLTHYSKAETTQLINALENPVKKD